MKDSRTALERAEDAVMAIVLVGLGLGFVTGLVVGQMLGVWGRE